MKWFNSKPRPFNSYSKCFLIFAVSFLFYACYGEYKIKQSKREYYENYITLMLQSYCGDIIRSKFNEHASLFYINKDRTHFSNGVEHYGNLIMVKGHSTIYFEGFAPQDIYCSASMILDPKMDEVSIDTNMEISLFGINYLPAGYSNPKSRTLTIERLNNLYPLSFGATLHFHKLQQSIFNWW